MLITWYNTSIRNQLKELRMTDLLNKLISGNKNLRLDLDYKFHDWSSWFECLPFMEEQNSFTAFDI